MAEDSISNDDDTSEIAAEWWGARLSKSISSIFARSNSTSTNSTSTLTMMDIQQQPPLPPIIDVQPPVTAEPPRHHKFLTDREPWTMNPNSCYVCFVHACDENESISCEQCNRHFCNACAMPPSCSECTKVRCQWCTNVVSCGRCNKQSCASHGYESCGGCDKVYCVDCHDELENCLVCNEYYCSEACHQRVHQ